MVDTELEIEINMDDELDEFAAPSTMSPERLLGLAADNLKAAQELLGQVPLAEPSSRNAIQSAEALAHGAGRTLRLVSELYGFDVDRKR